MKIDPVSFILEQGASIDKRFYFVSGNENLFIDKVKNTIIKRYSKRELINLDTLDQYDQSVSLFNSQRIFILEKLPAPNKEFINSVSPEDVFVFAYPNSPKIKNFKNLLANESDGVVIDCYELSKDDKVKILNKKINESNIEINQELFWELIEKLDNKYVFLENELEKIFSLRKENLNREDINKIFSNNAVGAESVFFNVLKSNAILAKNYNQKITNYKEVNSLFYVFKQFSFLILQNNNENLFLKSIPAYLFREKKFFLDLYRKFDLKKKKKLSKLLYETEKEIRKNNTLSVSLGLRFVLLFKKISIS